MPRDALTMVGTLRRWLALTLEAGAIVAFLVMVVSLILQILFRYVLAVVAPWTEELARFACIWSVFLATAVCFDEGAHIRLDLIVTKVSRETTKRIMLLASVVVTGTFVVVVLYGSILLSQVGWVDFATTIPVRMGVVYLALPVSMVAIALFGILRAMEVGVGRLTRDGGRLPEQGSPCS
jgi:TRAP-type C4-dicarboxylate transport system permease small subunit